jgi:hypothetical protein
MEAWNITVSPRSLFNDVSMSRAYSFGEYYPHTNLSAFPKTELGPTEQSIPWLLSMRGDLNVIVNWKGYVRGP